MSQVPEGFIPDSKVPDGFIPDPVPAENTRVGRAPASNRNREWGASLLNAIPYVTGAAGGLLGGAGGTVAGLGVGGAPGAIGGAAVGGAGGEAVRQLLARALDYPAPETPAGAAAGIGRQAATQGALEGGGSALAWAARPVAKALMRSALRPSPALSGEFGDVTATALRERVPVGTIKSRAGSKAVRGKLRSTAAELNKTLEEALRQGWYFKGGELRPEIETLIRDVGDFQGLPGATSPDELAGMLNAFLEKQGGAKSPKELYRLKQQAQRMATQVFKAQSNLGYVPPNAAAGASFNNAVQQGGQRLLDELPPGPGGRTVTQLDDRLRELIGLRKAVRAAENRNNPSTLMPTLAGAGGGVLGNMLGQGARGALGGMGVGMGTAAVLRTPALSSRLALGLTDPLAPVVLANGARVPAYLLLRDLPAYEPTDE